MLQKTPHDGLHDMKNRIMHVGVSYVKYHHHTDITNMKVKIFEQWIDSQIYRQNTHFVMTFVSSCYNFEASHN